MYAISRHEEGICLNPREYVIDDKDKVILFSNPGEAITYLRSHWEDMPLNTDDLDEYGVFIEPYMEVNHESSK